MQSKLIRFFIWSAAALLLVTAIAKLISGFGNAGILKVPDPLFGIPFRTLFWIIGGIELATASVCFLSKRVGLQAGLVAWLATGFAVYRFGLWWTGYSGVCHCLGNFTDLLHISSKTADSIMKVILAYLLIGSYAALLWLWKQRQKTVLFPSPAQTPPTTI